MLKPAIRALLKRSGLRLLRSNAIPFGFDWCIDIKHLCGVPSADAEVTTCFDVGANLGQTASRLVQAFPTANVYSFEPVPATFQLMKRNTDRMQRVQTFNIGMSDTTGQCEMLIADASGRSRVGSGVNNNGVLVQLDTLDHFCRQHSIGTLNVLKIDVEGHELPVLRGAEILLRNGNIHYLVCECDFVAREDEPHGQFSEIVTFLQPFGFRIVSFYTGGVDSQGWRWGDVLFALPGSIMNRSVSCSPLQ